MPTTNIRTLDGYSGGWNLESIPDECPICHAHMSPNVLMGVTNDGSNPKWAQVAMQCTRRECQSMFVALYAPGTSTGHARFVRAVPVTPRKPTVPDSVA